ncbi:ABC transporter ATP-binding protein [Flavobacteriaceae bacterium 3-367]
MSTSNPHIALEARDLGIGYSAKKVQNYILKGIRFSILQGELAAIVGINGVGKSTLLRTLGRVQRKLAGSIWVNNIPLEHHTPLELASKISIVLTEPIASKNLTVRELIALGRQPYTNWLGTLSPDDASKIKNAIAMVGLEALQYKKCYELSDGQLQKVMIARALAQDTSLILLDEPTTHLDLYHKVHILKLLKFIAHETGKTILFTTHEIDMAIQLCDKMVLLDQKGNTFGTPGELIQQKHFEGLFPPDTIRFDPDTASFKVNK